LRTLLLRDGPVDEVEVDVVEPQPAQRLLQRAAHVRLRVRGGGWGVGRNGCGLYFFRAMSVGGGGCVSELCWVQVACVGEDRVMEGVPELRRDKQVPAVNHSLFHALCDGCADLLLVFINPCSIDVPISCNNLARLIAGYLPRIKSPLIFSATVVSKNKFANDGYSNNNLTLTQRRNHRRCDQFWFVIRKIPCWQSTKTNCWHFNPVVQKQIS
jgi:hypothetical protein